MNILLYSEGKKTFSKSGVGRALKHQQKALTLAGVSYTLNSKDDYDLVHINTVFWNSYHILKQAKKHNKKIICHAHSTEEDFKNSFILSNVLSPIFKRLLLRMYTNCDALITPTNYTKKVLEQYPNVTCDIYPISNGIDTNDFKYSEQRIQLFRTHFNVSKNDQVVISVGLLIKRKGFHDFISIARKFPNITFIWFGDAPKLLMTSEIKQAIKQKPSNVILPGYVDGELLKGAYCGADLFFFPSYEENEGIVVLEALSSKQKVLIRDIPVYDDWMIDGVNCKKGNSNTEFELLIKEMIDNEYLELRENARKTALDRNLSIIGEQLKETYMKVLK